MSAFCPLTFAVAIAVIASPLIGVTQDKTTVQGEWSLNCDLTPALPKKGDDVRQPEGRRRPGGGSPAGGGGFSSCGLVRATSRCGRSTVRNS